jgi:hypothetical protein
MGTRRLVISGTLNQDPETDILITNLAGNTSSSRGVVVANGGVWNYGKLRNANDITNYAEGTGLFATLVATNGFGTQWLEVASGGRLNQFGGVFRMSSGIIFTDGCYVNIPEGTWVNVNTVDFFGPRYGFSSQSNANRVVIDKLKLAGNAILQVNPNSDFSPSIFKLILLSGAIRSTGASSTRRYFNDFDISKNGADYSVVFETDSATVYHEVYHNGFSEIPSVRRFAGGIHGGVDVCARTVKHSYQDIASNNPIQGVIRYFKETDNGNRAPLLGTLDYTATQTYIDTSDALGEMQREVNCLVQWAQTNVNAGIVTMDRRFNVDDTITFHNWAYGYGYDSHTEPYIGLGPLASTRKIVPDAAIALSVTEAAALSSIDTVDDLYDAAKRWKCSPAPEFLEYPAINKQLLSADGLVRDLGSLNLVVDKTTTAAFAVNTSTNTITIKADNLAAGVKGTSLKTTGTITAVNGATISAAVEDANGVRVTIRKSGGGLFNIAARYGTTGAYTTLGFSENVSTVTYTVPKGQPVEVVMWSLGCVTYSRTISTAAGGVAFDAEMTINESINTALDVSAYLPNIALSLDTGGANPVFVITFNAAMTISGIEMGKAVVHRLVGQQVALQAGFPPGSTATIVINADEITNQLPTIRLVAGPSLAVTDRVYLDFFINQEQALVINPNYVINPPRVDGNQVVILRAKPTLDSKQLSSAVREELAVELARLDVAVSTRLATTSYVSAPTASQNATAVRTELATELGRIDATVSSRLATTSYTAPANSDIEAIKAKTDTLVNGPTLAQIEASTVLAKEATVASKASQASVTALGTPLQASSYVPPDNASISEIKTKVNTLQNTDISGLPTLTEIEGSTVLAKQDTLNQVKTKVDTLENAPSADTIADSVWNEVLTGNTHNVNRSAGKRLRTLADTVILIEGIATDMSNPGDGTGLVTLTDATTVCIKQALRIGDQVRYVREFDPLTKVARVDRPWCTVLTGNQDYTVFNGRESDPVGAVTVTDLEVIKGQGFDTNKHSLVKIKKETSLAVALSA